MCELTEPEKTMGKDVAENGGEYSYKKVGDKVTDVHRTEPAKPDPNKKTEPECITIDDQVESVKRMVEASRKMVDNPGKEEKWTFQDIQMSAVFIHKGNKEEGYMYVYQLHARKDGKQYAYMYDLDMFTFLEARKHFEAKCTELWEKVTDPNKKIIVLNITTGFGKTFTCRTAEQLGQFIDNYKAEKRLKRDEDVNIQIGYGRMNQAEYDQVPECKYFSK